MMTLMHPHSRRTLDALQDFLATPLTERLGRETAAETRLLALFHETARNVPAYRDFLAVHGIDAAQIQDLAGFQRLPLMTKQNYMRAYPLPARCSSGTLAGEEMLAVSSGSTGTPMIWPRRLEHELDIAYRFEQVMHAFHADTRPTLAVVCFALGTWVGGMYTAACCRYLAMKGYPLTLVTPGNNQNEIFRAVTELGPHYEQIVLLGYPPFIKDVIDAGRAQNIDWPRYQPKLVFAGEVFSEEWRALLCERIGAADSRYATASLYGTADGGVLGCETPLSIAIRRFFAQHPRAAREVFGESRLPTLVQYDPGSRYFEVHDDTLVVSGSNGVPLIRYHIADKGGIYSYGKLLAKVRAAGGDPLHGLSRGAWKLPFVYLFGRADFTVSYYGANVYPENISIGLEQSGVREWVSGKFVMHVCETASHDKILEIVVELRPGEADEAPKRELAAEHILAQLLRLNSEYAHYVPREHQRPRIILKPAGDPEWFPPGVKHRYTRKHL